MRFEDGDLEDKLDDFVDILHLIEICSITEAERVKYEGKLIHCLRRRMFWEDAEFDYKTELLMLEKGDDGDAKR